MAVEDKKISYRMYFVAFMFLVMAVLILIKLNNIQWVEGPYYRKLAQERTVKNFTIPANKGNVYSADGSLLATSIPEYSIYFDVILSRKVTKRLIYHVMKSKALNIIEKKLFIGSNFQKNWSLLFRIVVVYRSQN